MTPDATEPRPAVGVIQPPPLGGGAIPVWKSMVVLLLSGLTALLCYSAKDLNNSTEAGVLMDLPEWVGDFDYHGKVTPISESEKTILPLDTEFQSKEYESVVTGQNIHCQIVLSGGEKRSIHRPEICLPSQGWTIKYGSATDVPLDDGKTLKVMQLRLARPYQVGANETKTLESVFMYWFIGRDRATPYHYERILLTSWDRVMKGTNHRWAYVIVSGYIPASIQGSGPDAAETEQTLKRFIKEVAPQIMTPQVLEQVGRDSVAR